MRKITALMLLAAFIISISPAIAGDFGASAHAVLEACRCSVLEETVTVTNTGQYDDSFIMFQGGRSASSVSYSPSSFSLKPGESIKVNAYIRPPCPAKGTYDLQTDIHSSSIQKTIFQAVEIKNCPNIEFTPTLFYQEVCCSPAVFRAALRNTGPYAETYELSVDSFKEVASFSENPVVLEPGDSKDILVYVKPECGISGEYDIGLNAYAKASSFLAKTTIFLNVSSCYDYTLSAGDYYPAQDTNDSKQEIKPHQRKYALCEQESMTIPVIIHNSADKADDYHLSFEGEEWSSMDNEELAVLPGRDGVINIDINPPKALEGEFNLTLNAVSETWGIKKSVIIPASVENCYLLSFDLPGKINVNHSETSTPVTIANTGSETADYTLSIEGDPWVSLDTEAVTIEAGASSTVNIITVPGEGVKAGKYHVTLRAEAPNGVEYTSAVKIKLKGQGFFARLAGKTASFLRSYKWYIASGFFALAVLLAAAKIYRLKKKRYVDLKLREYCEKPAADEKEIKKEVRKLAHPEERYKLPIIVCSILSGIIVLVLAAYLAWIYVPFPSSSRLSYIYAPILQYFRYIMLGLVLCGIAVWLASRYSRKCADISASPAAAGKKEKKQPKPMPAYKARVIAAFAVSIIIILALSANYMMDNEDTPQTGPAEYSTDPVLSAIEGGIYRYDKEGNVVNTETSEILSQEEFAGILLDLSGIADGASGQDLMDIGKSPECTKSVDEGARLVIDLTRSFNDPDNDDLTFTATKPENMAVEIEEGIATLTPDPGFAGASKLRFRADDGRGGFIESSDITICVMAKPLMLRISGTADELFRMYYPYLILGAVLVVIIIFLAVYREQIMEFLEEKPARKNSPKKGKKAGKRKK